MWARIATAAALAAAGLATLANAPASSAETGARVLHVDRRSRVASDDNPGTSRRPLRTIGAAVSRAQTSGSTQPTVIRVHPGTYRESVAVHANPDHKGYPHLKIVGVGGRAIVSGADLWRDWKGWQGGVYVREWPYDWGLSPMPPGWAESYAGDYLEEHPVIRRREVVAVAGKPLRQVMSVEQVLSADGGAFHVSEQENLIYLKPPTGVNPNQGGVEVALRPELLMLYGRSNVTIKNLTFQHASTEMGQGAVVAAQASDIQVVGSRFKWNNWNGLGFYKVKDMTIRNNAANHNGAGGISGFQATGLRMIRNETSYNNWRGSRGWDRSDHSRALDANLIDFATGQKLFRLRHALIAGHRSIGNLTGGLWLDFDNSDVVVRNAVMRDNLTHGIFVEANQGPVVIKNSALCGNETGVLIANSARGVVTGNVLGKNLISQMFIAGQDEPRWVNNHETGEAMHLQARSWRVTGNDISGRGGQTATATWLGEKGWGSFRSSLTSDNNRWLHQNQTRIFQVTENRHLDLQGWKSHTGQDRSSVFHKKAIACSK